MNIETLKEALKYVKNDAKTNEYLMTGHNCTAETAFEEMVAVKVAWGKTDGRQHIQIVQSFAPTDPVTAEQAHEIGCRLAKQVIPAGFQALVVTHVDREHIHNHFIINSVNMESGLKWKQGRDFLLSVREQSDVLCREFNLSVLPPRQKQDRDSMRGEYEASKDQRSWKHELRLAVRACLKNSSSVADFIRKMHELGYGVVWTKERKHVTFITPDGKKCRGRMLGTWYTKENMEQQFEKNRQHQEQRVLDNQMSLVGEAIRGIRNLQNPNDSGSGKGFKFPLSALEGQAVKEKAIKQKDKGLDWSR